MLVQQRSEPDDSESCDDSPCLSIVIAESLVRTDLDFDVHGFDIRVFVLNVVDLRIGEVGEWPVGEVIVYGRVCCRDGHSVHSVEDSVLFEI